MTLGLDNDAFGERGEDEGAFSEGPRPRPLRKLLISRVAALERWVADELGGVGRGAPAALVLLLSSSVVSRFEVEKWRK